MSVTKLTKSRLENIQEISKYTKYIQMTNNSTQTKTTAQRKPKFNKSTMEK